MIEKLVVSNYRSLGRSISIRPGRLCVLVGPNGSGKSNTLDVLSFVRDAVTVGLPAAVTHRGGIDSVRRRSHGRPFDVHIDMRLVLPNGAARYLFTITGDRLEEYRVKFESAEVLHGGERHSFQRDTNGWFGPRGMNPRMDEQSLALTALGGTELFKPLVDVLSQMVVYSIFPHTLRVPQRFDPARPMKRHGENWVSVLRELIRHQPAKSDLVLGLGRLTGDIEDVRVTSAAAHLIAEFKQKANSKKKKWFDAAQQSDGTLRVAGLLTALLQEPALPVIGIEEPELTVHPGVLPMLYDYLKQASGSSQVIITTHSPIILDVVDIDTDTILVVNRAHGETTIKEVTRGHLEPVRKQLLRLGELFTSGDLPLSLFEEDEE